MMTLHWSPRSPYVRKVMIAASELGLSDQLHCVRSVVGGIEPHLGLMVDNPLGKLPTLVLEDGRIFYDSVVICAYFDSLPGGGKLWPAAWPQRGTTLRRHALGDGMLDVGLACRSEQVRPAEEQSSGWIALWMLKLRTCVDALEREADDLTASPFDIGQLTIGVALGYLDFRFAEENWRDGHPRLAEWHANFNARPSVAANRVVDDF